MGESDKPPETPQPEKPLSPWKQFIEDASWDIPGARAFGNLFLQLFILEGKAVKNGWFAFMAIAALFFYWGHSHAEKGIDEKFNDMTNYFSDELSKQDSEIDKIKGQLVEARQDRDKYQIMLAPFEAMAIAKYTNAPLDERLDLLTHSITEFTNIISAINSDQPILYLDINGIKVVGHKDPKLGDVLAKIPIFLNANRQITTEVGNDSLVTAEDITINFSADIDPTNFIAEQWGLEPKSANGWNNWRSTASGTSGAMEGWEPQTIEISEAFQPRFLNAYFFIHADRSATWEYVITFVFPPK